MKTLRTIAELRKEIKTQRSNQRSVGFVPTMGYLHQGHLSLVEASKKENDVTVVSIFVNPTQFAPNEDLAQYPRDLQRDEAMLKECGVDLVFYPDTAEMYPEGYCTYVEVEKLGNVLCGKSRSTHFRGVTTVVMKLLNIVTPDNAYFGSKDAQQAVILKRMILDTNLDVRLKTAPIVRDHDGLALSSRNIYLSPEERRAALTLPGALAAARESIRRGASDPVQVRTGIIEKLNSNPLIQIDYVEVVTLDTLENLGQGASGKPIDPENTLVAAAVKVGKTRLIDNFILGEI